MSLPTIRFPYLVFTTFGSSQVPPDNFAVTPPSVHSGFHHRLVHRRFCCFSLFPFIIIIIIFLIMTSKNSNKTVEMASKQSAKLKKRSHRYLLSILADKTSRNLFFFLCLNLSFAFVELTYGIWSNSLGLISDSFHMFFDCTALLAGLAASVISRWRSNDSFSYGYVRAEVLAGFVNGLFLIFTAFFIMSEGIERAVEPPDVHHERLLPVSVAGLIVNLVGIFVFQHGGHGHSHGDEGHGHSHSLFNGLSHSHGGHDHHKHDHGHGGHGHEGHGHGGHEEHNECPSDLHPQRSGSSKQILQGVLLHIMADTLGSVGVIISALLMQKYDLMIADPICSILIALLIAVSVVPLLKDSIGILMQRTPPSLDHALPDCYQRVQQLQGVYNLQEPHFWTLCSDVYIGTLKLLVAPDADTRWILSQTHNIFTQAGVRQLYVQMETAAM
ncbi:zinc transporter 7 isoform X2 [Takifugu flavidus]|uniref:zinc transporter 7 isoform X2 n=1 Tax=Takifugu flavidus TaxID=433684 RepID=UPI002543FC39|nr:zinc transporter 7 isoform X2 [Takifugu flavidus]